MQAPALENLSPIALRVSAWFDALLCAEKRSAETAKLFIPHVIIHRFSRQSAGIDRLLADWNERHEAFAEPSLTHEIIYDAPDLVVANYVLRGHLVGRCSSIIPTGAAVWTMGIFFFHLIPEIHRANEDQPIVGCVRDEWDTSDLLHQLGIVIPTGDFHKGAYRPGAKRKLKVPTGAHLTIWARHFSLSPRLAQVGSLLLSGATTASIADTLGLSISSLRTYIRTLYATTEVHSQPDFVRRIAHVSGVTTLRKF